MLKPSVLYSLLRNAFREFREHNPLRLAAATAFFTTFALPPILIILIRVLGIFLNPRTISRNLFEQLGYTIGKNTVAQVREILRNVRFLSLSWYVAIAGFIFLLFIASTLFSVIKDSLNELWRIQLKEKPKIIFVLGYRIKSIAIIIIAGILFLVVLLGETVGALSRQYIRNLGPNIDIIFTGIINQVISTITVVTWFTVVFKFLSDGRPVWRIAIAGGIFTGLLFTAGKLLLRWLLSYNNMLTIYGASTSVLLLLLFVFYSAFIFYYGACFTQAMADYNKHPILPKANAMRYIVERVELDENGQRIPVKKA